MTPIKLLAVILLVSVMLNAGLQCNREHLLAALKDRVLIAKALVANFIIVPVVAVIVARLFRLNGDVATGMLLMAIAPGVPFVVFSGGRKKGGSLGLAIALAFLMPALTVLTFPLTAQLVLPTDSAVHLSAARVLVPLIVFQLVPLLLGILISFRAPKIAERISRPLIVVAAIALIGVLVLFAPTLGKSLAVVFGTHGMLAILVVVALSLLTGWTFGGPVIEYRRTLSIATALRNVGLCLVIVGSYFPDTLVGPTVITYFVIQLIVSSIAGAYLKRIPGPAAAATA